MGKTYIESAAVNGYKLEAVITTTCDGINIYVGGGELSHIGAIVVSQPRESLKGDGSISCTTSVFNIVGHKDDGIAVPLCEEICKKAEQVVVVTAGVHIDNATASDIDMLKACGDSLTKKILNGLNL